jgi:putative FmdB family regulatory protein
MPIYEYRCPNGHTFEVFQRMTDPPVGVCETCFYSTDYGRGSRKPKDSESGSSSDGAAKSDQPAAKSDAKSSEPKSKDS